MRKTTHTVKRQHELKIANDTKSNPKVFCVYSRAHLKTKSGMEPLFGDPGDLSSINDNDTDKAEVPQHQFCRVFTRQREGDIPILECTAEKLAAVEVTPDMMLKRLIKLKVGTSCGPDEIHPRILCVSYTSITFGRVRIYRACVHDLEAFLLACSESWKNR